MMHEAPLTRYSVPQSPSPFPAGLQTPKPVSSPSPTKRKTTKSIEDTVCQNDSVQRLVEYFVTVSSHPRWEVGAGVVVGSPDTPMSSSPTRRRRHRKKHILGTPKLGESTRKVMESSATSLGGSNSDNIHLPGNQMPEYSFQPKVTARYPSKDHTDNPLNPMITQFCYPHSDTIVPSSEYVMPRVHHFVLTNEKGRKIYGTCLTVYEEYTPSHDDPFRRGVLVHHTMSDDETEFEITIDKDADSLYLPKVLCILSTWPYLSAFREYLTKLYQQATTTDTLPTPIERCIVNICEEIPCPPPGAFEVQVKMLESTINFWAPPAKLPIAYVALPYQTLFECLDINNILMVWYALVMELKVVLHSSQYSLLTICSEIFCSMLFPMQWSHLYIPMLPRFLSPMLDAPIPYLVGVIQDNWVYAANHINEEAIIVDLDNNKVTIGPRTPKLPTPPAKKWTKLQLALERRVGEVFWAVRGLETEYRLMTKGKITQYGFEKLVEKKGNLQWKGKLVGFDDAFSIAYTPDSPNLLDEVGEGEEAIEAESKWDAVQEAFLRFFVSALKSYKKFLHLPSPLASDADSPATRGRWNSQRTFDLNGFVAWQKVETQPFYNEFCVTQMFDDFITKRMYSPGEPYVIFFDQSIEAKLNKSRMKVKKVETPFLLSAKAHKVLKKIDGVEPNDDGLPPRETSPEGLPSYTYDKWPETFDQTLFSVPRPTPSMISAEFDRQAALVNKLRASCDEQLDGELEEGLLGGAYEPNPEVATFTLFLFTYGAVIGLEWQKYQEAIAAEERGTEVILRTPPPPPPPPPRYFRNEEKKEDTPLRRFLRPQNSLRLEDLATEDMHMTSRKIHEKTREWTACAHDEVTETAKELGFQTENFEKSFQDTTKSLEKTAEDFTMCAQDEMKESAYEWGRLETDLLKVDCSGVCPDCASTTPCGNTEDVFFVTRWYETQPAGRGGPTRGPSLLDFDGETLAEYEEARAVANAQLDLAFEILKTISLRRLATDSDAYKSLMAACGRCGDTQRAVRVMEMMRKEGVVADSEIYACFMKCFAADDGVFESPLGQGGHDPYFSMLKKKLRASRGAPSVTSTGTGLTFADDETNSMYSSDSDSDTKPENQSFVTDILNSIFGPPPAKPKKRKAKRSSPSKKVVLMSTGPVQKQTVLGKNLLDYLYPALEIDTNSEACPQCSNILSEDDVVKGWIPCQFHDYMTKCPQCRHRFVPKFTVTSSSPTFEGSQGPATPLYCEFLSPWVMRKQLDRVVNTDGVEAMLAPGWRSGKEIQAALFWNQIVLFHRYKLPVSFLLQGSFQNRLINPTPDG